MIFIIVSKSYLLYSSEDFTAIDSSTSSFSSTSFSFGSSLSSPVSASSLPASNSFSNAGNLETIVDNCAKCFFSSDIISSKVGLTRLPNQGSDLSTNSKIWEY